jgi:hypothetical protein
MVKNVKKMQIPQPDRAKGNRGVNLTHKDSITPNYNNNHGFLQYSDDLLEIAANLMGAGEVDQ